jgi:sugar phosphate isomerase/epimerase
MEAGTRAPASELVLFAGSLPATPYRDFVGAAASAGFDAVSLWPLMYRRAQSREGLDPATMRAIADDAGIRVTDLDPCGDWLPADPDAPSEGIFRADWGREQFFEAAAVLGSDTIVAVHLTGGRVEHAAAVDGFGTLCDDAAAHGLRVALEFMPFSGIPDLASGWSIVREADRPNGGLVLDVAHFVRSGRGDDLLASIPPERVYSVQLADGPAESPGDLVDEAMYHRRPPGEGDFGVAALLATLAARGVRARVGPELYQRSWGDSTAAEVAAALMAATRAVLGPDAVAPGSA